MTDIFVTKYALKSGIHRVSAEVDEKGVAVVRGAFPWQREKFSRTDYATDMAQAQVRAHAMAIGKANKLEREAADFRALASAFKQEG
jgi:hypothetical protein